MAGGVNPFGFAGGVIPAPRSPRPARGPADIPAAPFGFAPPPSKMQQTLAILNEYNPLPAFERLLKSPMALGGPISEQDIADGLTVAGTVTGGSAAAPKPKNALNMGIRAFHGSPHDFPPVRLIEMPDGQRLYQNMNELAETPQGARIIQEFPLGRFDMSKIGTGEGAQAYGHGLYFAEDEAIAKSYREALKHKGAIDIEGEAYRLGLPLSRDAQIELRRQAAVDKNDPMRAAMWLQSASAQTRGMPQEKLAELIDRYRNSQKGHMYEVEINADPDAFLDWDKPLSEQPEKVRKGLEAAGFSPPPGGELMTGAQVYSRAMQNDPGAWGSTKEYVRAAMNELGGIPGIKYLDAGSRGAGDGTRNYVVFDDNLISIVRKYGIAGASAMLGYNILDGMDPAQADELKRIEGNQ